jgi:hypothetical protein
MPTSADRLNRQSSLVGQAAQPKVLSFSAIKRDRVEATVRRFSIVDRMAALAWAESAHSLGYTRLVFEPAAHIDGAPAGEFLLIYARDCAWSSWGVGCDNDGLTLWHAPRGKTIGRFRDMHDALDKIRAITVGE